MIQSIYYQRALRVLDDEVTNGNHHCLNEGYEKYANIVKGNIIT